jgi:tRNA(His) 5'-end guanylyltransferase
MIYEFVEWARDNLIGYINMISEKTNNIDIDKRMKCYIDKSSYIRECDYKKPYVISLKSKNILKYINHLTNIDEKLEVMTKLNDILQNVCNKIYNQFDVHLMYSFNNEINLIFKHKQMYDLPYNGNIARILSNITSYVTKYYMEEMNKYELSMQPIFEARYIEFDQEYEVLNYIIWRQLDCKRNNLSLLYKCLSIDTINNIEYNKKQDVKKIYNAKVDEILESLIKYNNNFMELYNNLIYGNIIKKQIIYKETSNMDDVNDLGFHEYIDELSVRKIVDINSYDLITREHDELLNVYIINKYL